MRLNFPPYVIFTKFGLGKVGPGPHRHAKFHCCGFKNVGLQPQNRKKMVIFGINLPQRVYPLKRFLQNLSWGRKSRVRTVMPNFIVAA